MVWIELGINRRWKYRDYSIQAGKISRVKFMNRGSFNWKNMQWLQDETTMDNSTGNFSHRMKAEIISALETVENRLS